MGSDFARLFMERSITSPLTIILSFNFGEDEDEKHHDPTTPILDVLAQHSARWFDVRLHLHQKPVEYPELAPIRGHLPLLQYLDVQVDDRISEDDDEDDEDILWDFFAECPSLHTVSLSVRGRFFDAIILPWEQVTCLKMPKGSSSPDELIP
ncbi:hypothetical protein MPER_03474 [Moniliophthora perniciosa FA553]|nr:hypothetical protein MPER_03474 [Moniliophthora perniciosa FA553]